jgi:hypothetical protein
MRTLTASHLFEIRRFFFLRISLEEISFYVDGLVVREVQSAFQHDLWRRQEFDRIVIQLRVVRQSIAEPLCAWTSGIEKKACIVTVNLAQRPYKPVISPTFSLTSYANAAIALP